MSKRVHPGHDATQEVSASQLVPEPQPPRVPRGKPTHDASMWMQSVVSSDDFAPVARKAPRGRRRPLVWGAVLLAAAAAAGGALWYLGWIDGAFPTAAPAASSITPAPASSPISPTAPSPAAPAVAAPVTPPADAAVAEVPAEPALEVDAVSSVGAIVTPATPTKVKKKATRKPLKKATRKKKTATKKPAAKKRR